MSGVPPHDAAELVPGPGATHGPYVVERQIMPPGPPTDMQVIQAR
nr:hypothetical protein [Herbidospora sakaeratensis]